MTDLLPKNRLNAQTPRKYSARRLKRRNQERNEDKNMKKIVLLFIAIVLGLPGSGSAVKIERGAADAISATVTARRCPDIQGPMRITLTPMTENPKIGDRVLVEVLVEAQPSITLEKMEYPETLNDWEVVYAQLGKPDYVNGQFVRKDILTLQTFVSGEVQIPALIQKFSGPDGKASEFHSAPIIIKVKHLLPRENDEPGKIRGLKDPRGMTSWWLLGSVLLAAGVLAAALFWFDRYRKLRQQTEASAAPTRPADEIAKERLLALRNSTLILKGQWKKYYSELSGIARHYIENQFRIPAIDRTTHELLREIKGTAIPRQDVNAIRNVLEQSDMVKFAKFQPMEKEAQADWIQIYEAVEHTTRIMQETQQQEQEEKQKP